MPSIEIPVPVLTVETTPYEAHGYEGTEVDILSGSTLIKSYRINNWDTDEAVREALSMFGGELREVLYNA